MPPFMPVTPTRVCKSCGAEFVPADRRHWSCSADCRAATARPPSDTSPTRKCVTCGTEFVRLGRAHRYCTVACRASHIPGSDPPAPGGSHAGSMSEPRACRTCGKEFVRSGRAHRFCSVACRASHGTVYTYKRSAEPRKPRAKSPAVVERLAKALALRTAGLTYRAIGEQLGVSKQRVQQILASIPGRTVRSEE